MVNGIRFFVNLNMKIFPRKWLALSRMGHSEHPNGRAVSKKGLTRPGQGTIESLFIP
jgi:hypothetical protein